MPLFLFFHSFSLWCCSFPQPNVAFNSLLIFALSMLSPPLLYLTHDDSPKSPPKEEDDMRAAEVLQGLKGIGGN